ncbi:MAG: potassium transporter TrkG [Bacteroidota bacterium]
MSPLLRAGAHDVGLALVVIAALALTGLGVTAGAGEMAGWWAFGGTALGGGTLGAGLLIVFRDHRDRSVLLARRTASKRVVAAAWLLASVLAAVPFAVFGASDGANTATVVYADPLNAWFESMSGLTSTGLSVSPDASQIPASLQWWRSLLQWVGGIGILYVVLALMPDERDASHLAELKEEMSTGSFSPRGVLGPVWLIYTGYTLATIAAFWIAGMPPWEAVNHGMTTLATGGFDITGDSFASYDRTIQFIGIVAMALGAISFGVHLVLLARARLGAIARDEQNRLMAVLLAGGGLLLWAATALGPPDVAVFDVAFLWTSALLTGGFATQDLSAWGALPLLLLILAMLIGGASGSTAGGLKQRRVLALLRWAKSRERSGKASAALRQVARLGAVLIMGTVALVLVGGAGWLAALFETASALGTVGLTAGVTGPDLPAGARLVLVLLMWVGRLEIGATLALFAGRGKRTESADGS